MSSLLSRVYVERTVHNPTYDIEEGAPSTNVIADSLDTAREPTEVYEEIPNESSTINQEVECDVYDVPEALTDNQLEAYATTDVSGKELFDAYAVTDISQAERQCSVIPPTKQTTPQRGSSVNKEKAKVKTSLPLPAKQTPPQTDVSGNKVKLAVSLSAKPTNTQKASSVTANAQKAASEIADMVRENVNAVPLAKQTAPPPPSSGNGTKDKTGVDAYAVSDTTSDAYKVKKIRVRFEDEDRRRSKSYTGVGLEGANQEEVKDKASTRSSVKGKPFNG